MKRIFCLLMTVCVALLWTGTGLGTETDSAGGNEPAIREEAEAPAADERAKDPADSASGEADRKPAEKKENTENLPKDAGKTSSGERPADGGSGDAGGNEDEKAGSQPGKDPGGDGAPEGGGSSDPGSSGAGSDSGEGSSEDGNGHGPSGEGGGEAPSGEGSGSGEEPSKEAGGEKPSGEDGGSGDGPSGEDGGEGASGEDGGSGDGPSKEDGGNETSGDGQDDGGNTGDDPSAGDPEDPTTDPPTDTPTDTPTADPNDFEIDEHGVLTAYRGSAATVIMPDHVTGIGKGAFQGNSALEKVVFPDGLVSIGEEAFADCTELRTIHLPESLEEVGDRAFAQCVNLQTVEYDAEDSSLASIGAQAFLYCVNIDSAFRHFAEGLEGTAENAFEGVPEDPTPTPTETETPTPTPTPTVTPDPYEDIEWEGGIDSIGGGNGGGSGGGSGKKKVPHAKSRTVMTHDYDQIQIAGGQTVPMHELTLGGETLPLALRDADGLSAEFTAAFAAGDQLWDGTAASAEQVDTLILTAGAGEESRWEMNGEVLRKLNKSGIEYLTFMNGAERMTVPTEGFLAGWAYDELKRQGTAGRRFEYALRMTGDSADWTVTVADQAYQLDEDPLSPIYLTGIEAHRTEPRVSGNANANDGT